MGRNDKLFTMHKRHEIIKNIFSSIWIINVNCSFLNKLEKRIKYIRIIISNTFMFLKISCIIGSMRYIINELIILISYRLFQKNIKCNIRWILCYKCYYLMYISDIYYYLDSKSNFKIILKDFMENYLEIGL